MAQITYNSHLIEMVIAGAALIPASSDFITVRDARNRPMIFSIGNDKVFRIIHEDKNLTRCLTDLGAALGLADGEKITTFDVRQALDSTIFLVAATGRDDNPSWSRLFILKPFKPSTVDLFNPEAIRDLVIPQNQELKSPVRKVLVGQQDGLESYPLVVIAYHNSSQDSEQEFIARVAVSNDLGSWSLATDLNLPTNASKVLDFYPGTVTGARGLFVLYEVWGNRRIVFTGYSLTQDAAVSCPPNATRLMTFTNANGKEDLIIAGDGLWHIPAKSLGKSNAKYKKLVDTPAFTNVKDLDISRVDINGTPTLSIWAANSRNAISYLKFDGLDVSGMSSPEYVEVIPEGQGGYFSSFLDGRGNQSLVYAKEDGDLVLLEQAAETGLWNKVPLIVHIDSPSTETAPSYLCTVSILDAKSDLPVPNASVNVSSAAWVNLSANGKSYYITPDGLQLEADNTGEIAFVIPASDISSTALTIHSVKKVDGTILELEGGQFRIDPSYYTIKELGKIENAEQLKNAKTPFGDPVFDKSNISDEDFHKAADAFKSLQVRHEELASGAGTATCLTAQSVAVEVEEEVQVTWKPLSWFYWIERQVKKVIKWTVEMVESAWTFVVDLGNKAYRFILDTVEAVMKTMSWIWNDLIRKPFEEMIRWIGLALKTKWNDILATSELVKGMINATLEFGAARIGEVADYTDEAFNTLTGALHDSLDRPAVVAQRNENLNNKKKKSDPTIIDTALDWIRYEIKQSGKSLKSKVEISTTNKEEATGLHAASITSLWQDLLKPFLAEMGGTFLKLLEGLLSIFESGRTVSINDLLQQMGADLLIGTISSLQRIIVGALRVLSHIFEDIKDLLNTRFQLPLTFGHMLDSLGIKLPTLLEAISFIIAIPTTIIRAATGGGNSRGLPKKFSTKEMGESFQGTLKDRDAKRHRDICRFTSDLGVAIVPLSGLADLGKIAISTFTLGSGIAGPQKLREIEGVGMLLLKAAGALAAWPMDPKMPGCNARKAIALVGLGNATIELLIRLFVTAPGKLKIVACVEIASVLASMVLIPMIGDAELDASEIEYPDKDPDVSRLTVIGKMCENIGKLAASGAVILVDPASVGIAAGVSATFNVTGALFMMSSSTKSLENHAWEVEG